MSISPVVHYDHEVTIWHMEQELREKDAEIARLNVELDAHRLVLASCHKVEEVRGPLLAKLKAFLKKCPMLLREHDARRADLVREIEEALGE